MMFARNEAQKSSIPLLPLIIALAGPFIGWLGAAMVLLSFVAPALASNPYVNATLGNTLMCFGPMIGTPAFIVSGWKNKQPSWVLAGLAYAICWLFLAQNGQNYWAIGSLIFMVGFAFSGLSNLVMPEASRRELPLTLANVPKLIPFIAEDVALTMQIAVKGTASIVAWPFRSLLSDQRQLPTCLSPQELWQSRRLAAFYFSVAGLTCLSGCFFPSIKGQAMLAFNILGGLSSFLLNYSLFFTGLKGKHWMDKLLLPASLLATTGSSLRSMPWGFALDQFGSRLSDMYFNGLQFRVDERTDETEAPAEDAPNNELAATPA